MTSKPLYSIEKLQELIKERAASTHGSIARASKLIGDEGYLYKVINGRAGLPGVEKLSRIMSVLKINPSEIDYIMEDDMAKIPVLGKVPGGRPIEPAKYDGDRFVHFKTDRTNLVALQVDGESMNRRVINGSYIIVDPAQTDPLYLINAMVVALKGDDATFKVLKKEGDNYILRPDTTGNAAEYYCPILDDTWRIFGKAVAAITNFE